VNRTQPGARLLREQGSGALPALPPGPALDAGALDRLADAVGADNIVEIMDLIIESVPASRAEIRVCAQGTKPDRLERAAHQLKSDCASMGATGLAARLQDVESRAHAGTAQPAGEIDLVSDQLDWFLEALWRAGAAGQHEKARR